MRRIRLIVHGEVQGVGFRAFTRRCAVILCLQGWVRNRNDGTVEAELIGTAEALEKMLGHLREGPRWSQVDEIEITSAEDLGDAIPEALPGEFTIR